MASTRQITKAMEMVASSKLRQAQSRVEETRPYCESLWAVMNEIPADRQIQSPYLTPRPVSRSAYVVIAGDRGLAGGYHSSILKMAQAQMENGTAQVLPVGKKAAEHFRGRGVPLLTERYAQAEALTAEDCVAMAEYLCRGYRDGAYHRIVLYYTGFASALSQEPRQMALLPLAPPKASAGKRRNILFEPGAAEVMDAIVPVYLSGMLYSALCQSRCAEQAARRIAMNAATENADEMIARLRTEFNQARQAAITQEITEIVAGSQ